MKKIPDIVEVVGTDLKALLFWASVGVEGSVGGSFEVEIETIIKSYADFLGMKPEWDYNTGKFKTSAAFYAEKFGSRGGKASAAKLSSEQKKARATKASFAAKAKRAQALKRYIKGN